MEEQNLDLDYAQLLEPISLNISPSGQQVISAQEGVPQNKKLIGSKESDEELLLSALNVTILNIQGTQIYQTLDGTQIKMPSCSDEESLKNAAANMQKISTEIAENIEYKVE